MRSVLLTFLLVFPPASAINVQDGGASSNSLHVAVLLPWTGEWPIGPLIGGAAVVATQKIITDGLLPAGLSVDWEWRDTQCKRLPGVDGAMAMLNETDDLDAFIGGGCSSVCSPVALVAAAINVPFISFGCTSDDFSDKTVFPTFSRTVGPWSLLGNLLDQFMEAMNWKTRAGIVTSGSHIMISTSDVFRTVLEQETQPGHTRKHVIYKELAIVDSITHRHVAAYMKHHARVIIVMMQETDLHDFMLGAHDEGMLNGDFVFITIDSDLYLPSTSPRPTAAKKAFNGVFDLRPRKPPGTPWDTFAGLVYGARNDVKFQGYSTALLTGQDKVDVHAMFLHDAFLTWAHGVTAAHSVNTAFVDNGREITNHITGTQIQGALGSFSIDSQGDRKPDYSVTMLKDMSPIEVFSYSESTRTLTKVYKPSDPKDFTGLPWMGGRSGPPPDYPPCGWDNEYCEEHSQVVLIASLSVCLSLLVVSVVGLIVYRRWSFMKDLFDVKSWRVTKEDLSSSRVHGQVALCRQFFQTTTKTSLVNDKDKQYFCSISTVRGRICAVKHLNKTSVNATDRDILLEMKQMREMQHENINPFVAAVCEHPFVSVCMLYADRGSLQDVIFNENVTLTWDFAISFAYDIAKGMAYLHSSPFGSHGHLTSSNCVVDNRWVCKITDYGCAKFKAGHKETKSEHQQAQAMLWTAPELLLWPPAQERSTYGTKKGDSYSYGIILYELHVKDNPYSIERADLEAEDIIKKVAAGQDPPFRPDFGEADHNVAWSQLAQLCWHEDPEMRPSFKGILSSLRSMNAGGSFNLVERITSLMEDYSLRLEEIAASCRDQVQVEKTRVENLLSNLLPRCVAEKLQSGQPLQPKQHDSVTVMSTQLVNMDELMSSYEPSQLVEILNEVSTSFDEVASIYSVVKIEINMRGVIFASGCPEPTDNHAQEISELAVDLLAAFSDWSHPTIPDVKILLKVGISSGSLVEAIVGLKVPRYCLCGQTINVAMQLAKSSEVMMAHVAESTVQQLPSQSFHLMDGPGISLGDVTMATFYLHQASI